MINKLVEQRQALLKEFDAIKKKAETEKRSAYNNEERTRVNEIKIALNEVDSSIADEKAIEESRSKKLDLITVNTPSIITSNVNDEFRSLVQSGKSGKWLMPMADFEKRSTITTSSNSHFKFTDSKEGVSIDEAELILESLGAQVAYFESGAVDYPSMSAIVASFGTEDGSVSDQSLTTAKKTLTPAFVSASLEVSKVFLATSKQKNIDDLKNALVYAVKKAVEKQAIDSMASLTAVASGATGNTGQSLHKITLNMEAAINGAGTGYIFSKSGVERAKNAKIDAGSGALVWKDGYVNGYAARRSALQTNAGYAYFGDFRSVVLAYFGDGITIEMVTDGTMARKGNVLLIASGLAHGSYTDANKVAVAKNILTAI